MICPNCHSNIIDNSSFCQYCGYSIRNIQNNLQQNKEINQIKDFSKTLCVTFICFFLIAFLLSMPFIQLSYLYPQGKIVEGNIMTMKDVVRLSAEGEELSWEDFEGYRHYLRVPRLETKYNEKTYFLSDKVKKYEGIRIKIRGYIDEKPRHIMICFYETDMEMPGEFCVKEIDIRNQEQYQKFLLEYEQNMYVDENSSSMVQTRTQFYAD